MGILQDSAHTAGPAETRADCAPVQIRCTQTDSAARKKWWGEAKLALKGLILL